MKNNDLYIFSEETKKTKDDKKLLYFLIIDQDKEFQESADQVLKKINFEKYSIRSLKVDSLDQAINKVKEGTDIASVFINIDIYKNNENLFNGINHLKDINKNIRILLYTLFSSNLQNINKILDNNAVNGFFETNNLNEKLLYEKILVTTNSYLEIKTINDHLNAEKEIAIAAERFIPQNFLKLLNKDNIAEIELNDHALCEMSVLFLDIRSYTALSEFLMPKESFNFVNECISYLEPEIIKHKGFIDKYIGDSIMALFPASSDDAVKAAITMVESLNTYNLQRIANYQLPIKIGIGINTGKVAIGAVGFKDRMEITVISDVVNVASRIEKLNKLYDTSILISGSTFSAFKSPDLYNFRYLGSVELQGKKQEILIYEVFNADSEDILLLKKKTKNEFEKGINLYREGDLVAAHRIFTKIYQSNKHDLTTKFFVEKTNWEK